MRRACAILAFCLAAAVAGAAADNTGQTLSAFISIVNKTPFVATIAVAADNRTYSVNATAPKDILSKFTASVKDSVLTLSTSGSIILTSDKKANLTVRVPASVLQVFNTSGSGDAFVRGSTVGAKNFSLTNSGTGTATVTDLMAASLAVTNSGTGTTVVSGSPKTATVTSSGTSDTYIGGVTGSVSVTGTGVGTVYIISANGNVKISGSSSFLSNVYYSQGSCSISGCKQKSISLPKAMSDTYSQTDAPAPTTQVTG